MSPLIRIPKRFFVDHMERDLPCPDIVKETAASYTIKADDPNLRELISDATFYASEHGPDQLPAGLKASAKALLKAVSKSSEQSK